MSGNRLFLAIHSRPHSCTENGVEAPALRDYSPGSESTMSFEFRAKANRISFKCGRYNSNCSAFARPDRAAQQNREKIGSSAGRQLSPSRCCGPIVDSAEISLMECVFIFSALALSAKPLTYELGCPAFSQDFHFSGLPTVSTGFICFLFGISGSSRRDGAQFRGEATCAT